MNNWSAMLAALLSGSALPWVFRHAKRIATGESAAQGELLEAEARKTNVEANGLFADRLWAEIERLDRELKAVREELSTVKSEAADEKLQLENENKRLRKEVSRLTTRVSELEAERDRRGSVK